MYDMMREMTSEYRFGNRAVNLNAQRSVRGQTENFRIDPLTLAASERRNSTRMTVAHSRLSSSARYAIRMR